MSLLNSDVRKDVRVQLPPRPLHGIADMSGLSNGKDDMAIARERWEERAADYISVRNHLVRDYGYGLDSMAVNAYEERAANALSRAKGKRS